MAVEDGKWYEVTTWWQLDEEAAFWTSPNLERTRIAAVKNKPKAPCHACRCSNKCLATMKPCCARTKQRQEELNNVTSHGSLFERHCGIVSVVDIDWLHVLCPSTWTQRSLGDIGMQPLILKFWSWSHFEAKHVISFPLTMILIIYTLADVKTQSAEDCRKICEVEMRDLWFLTFQHLSRVFKGKLYKLQIPPKKPLDGAFGYLILAASQVKEVIVSNDPGIPKNIHRLLWTSTFLDFENGGAAATQDDVDDL